MVGSCSQPIKANKIISCGTRDSQHPIRTAATKRRRLTISTDIRLRIFSSLRIELKIFNIQSEQRQQRDDDLRSAIMSAVHVNCGFALHGVRNSRFSTFNQNSSNKETDDNSPISIRVYRPCRLLANCEFALRGSDSFR